MLHGRTAMVDEDIFVIVFGIGLIIPRDRFFHGIPRGLVRFLRQFDTGGIERDQGGFVLGHLFVGVFLFFFLAVRLGADLEALDIVFLTAAGFGLLFRQKRLPVGNGNLIIIRMDFRESEEALPVAAIFDERGLERRLHAGHFGEIDIAFERPLAGGLEIK